MQGNGPPKCAVPPTQVLGCGPSTPCKVEQGKPLYFNLGALLLLSISILCVYLIAAGAGAELSVVPDWEPCSWSHGYLTRAGLGSAV